MSAACPIRGNLGSSVCSILPVKGIELDRPQHVTRVTHIAREYRPIYRISRRTIFSASILLVPNLSYRRGDQVDINQLMPDIAHSSTTPRRFRSRPFLQSARSAYAVFFRDVNPRVSPPGGGLSVCLFGRACACGPDFCGPQASLKALGKVWTRGYIDDVGGFKDGGG